MESEKNTEQEALLGKERTPKKRSHKKKKVGKAVIIAVLSVFALIVGAGVYLINHYLGLIQHVDPEKESVLSPSEFEVEDSQYWASVNDPNYTAPNGTRVEDPENPDDPIIRIIRDPYQADAYRATLSADDEQVIFDHPVTPTMNQAGPLNDEDLINIMLIGQDTRNEDYRERSDSMILVSINPKTHKVAMISFLRDLYVPIGGEYGWNRLNTAFKIGGLKKMYEVYENVFGLHIDGGIYINFGQFMSLVNLLGGVDVTLNETEAKWLRTTLELSVPDMRYWGQIVEALMPSIKAGTTVKDAIQALTDAELTYAYADANGGTAPDNVANATVKALWVDTAGETAAKAGRYYPKQTPIYIEYAETRITFPTIPAEASVESVVKLLTGNGFKVEYADRNGNVAPFDSKSALVAEVYQDPAGSRAFTAGDKFPQDTVAYIAYTENVATVPTIPAGASVAEAESLLKAAGLAVSWSDLNGAAEPADKTTAKFTGVWLEQASVTKLNPGDKLDINATVYVSYELPEEPTTEEPSTEESSSDEPCKHEHMVDQYTKNNNGTHKHTQICADCRNYTVVISDVEPCDLRANGNPVPPTCRESGYTFYKCSKCGYEVASDVIPALGHNYVWRSNNNGTHSSICTRCNTVEKTDNCTYDENGICTVCGYKDPNYQPPTESSSETLPSSSDTPPSSSETQPSSETTPEETPEPETTASSEAETTEAGGEPAPGGDGGSDGNNAARSNEDLTVASDAANNSYVTMVPAAGEENNMSAVSVRGLYNPIVRPLSSVTSAASSSDPWYLQNIKPGRVHLDGMQTLAYCRMRKLDSDIKRTERQRTVLNILFNKVKSANIATLNALLEEILPQVKTDLSKTEILRIAAIVLPYFSSINLDLHSIPAQGTFSFAMINQQAVLTMNQAQNIEALRSWLPY